MGRRRRCFHDGASRRGLWALTGYHRASNGFIYSETGRTTLDVGRAGPVLTSRICPSTNPRADAPAGGGRDAAATRGARARIASRRSRRHPPRPPRSRAAADEPGRGSASPSPVRGKAAVRTIQPAVVSKGPIASDGGGRDDPIRAARSDRARRTESALGQEPGELPQVALASAREEHRHVHVGQVVHRIDARQGHRRAAARRSGARLPVASPSDSWRGSSGSFRRSSRAGSGRARRCRRPPAPRRKSRPTGSRSDRPADRASPARWRRRRRGRRAPPPRRVGGEEGREQGTVAAADINHPDAGRERIGLGDRAVAVVGTVLHEAIEALGVLRVRLQVLEARQAERRYEGRLPGPDGMLEIAPGRPNARHRPVERRIVQRRCRVRAEPRRSLALADMAPGIDGEDAKGRKRCRRGRGGFRLSHRERSLPGVEKDHHRGRAALSRDPPARPAQLRLLDSASRQQRLPQRVTGSRRGKPTSTRGAPCGRRPPRRNGPHVAVDRGERGVYSFRRQQGCP